MSRGMPAPLFILQANLNHARQAQDLFLHTMEERGCGLGVVAEPYAPPPPEHPSWFPGGCLGRGPPLVAAVRGGDMRSPPCRAGSRGRYYVKVWWGTICVVAVYFPPPSASRNSTRSWGRWRRW